MESNVANFQEEKECLLRQVNCLIFNNKFINEKHKELTPSLNDGQARLKDLDTKIQDVDVEIAMVKVDNLCIKPQLSTVVRNHAFVMVMALDWRG